MQPTMPSAWLASLHVPNCEEIEWKFSELKERIDKTLGLVSTVAAEQIEISEDRDISLKLRGHDVRFQGEFAKFCAAEFQFLMPRPHT